MGKGKDNSGSSIDRAFGTLVGCAQIIGTVIGVIALIVAFLSLAWAITHQEAAIQVVQLVSGEPTVTPMITTLPTGTPLPTYTPYPTHTPYPTYTPHIVPTPEPTEALPIPTPVVVTATPTPKPTEPPETPPGSVLSVGETWRQGGVSLTLDEVRLEPTYVRVYFTLRNESDHRILGSFGLPNIRIEDNLGNVFTAWHQNMSWDFNLEQKDTFKLGSGDYTQYNGNLANKAVEWVLISVNDVSDIQNARWKVSVYH